jgi:hypothetical protein
MDYSYHLGDKAGAICDAVYMAITTTIGNQLISHIYTQCGHLRLSQVYEQRRLH